jgi:hypothetical protein
MGWCYSSISHMDAMACTVNTAVLPKTNYCLFCQQTLYHFWHCHEYNACVKFSRWFKYCHKRNQAVGLRCHICFMKP